LSNHIAIHPIDPLNFKKVKPYYDSTAKTGFIVYYPKKIKLCIYCGSPHGGSPTQFLWGLQAFVGEGPCALPRTKTMVDFSRISTKTSFFQDNHDIDFLICSKSIKIWYNIKN